MFQKILSFFNHNLKPSKTGNNFVHKKSEITKIDFKNMTKDGKIKKIKEVFANIPCLETGRLILRRIKESDYIDIFEYSSDIDVTKYLTWYPHTSLKETKEYINYLQKRYDSGKFFDWGLVYKEDGKLVGTCGLTSINLNKNSCEVGYVLSKKYWGKGIIPEALECIMEFAFNYFGFERIEARYLDGNMNSRRVMQKAGMILAKIDHNVLQVKGEYKTVYTYYITKEMFDYRRNQKINLNNLNNIGYINNININYGKGGN